MKQNPFKEPLLTTQEATDYYRLRDGCLERHRWAGTGPHFVRLGPNGRVRYPPSDLDAWLITCKSTRGEG